MKNNWFDENGKLKISSEDLYCYVFYPNDKVAYLEIKKEIRNFIVFNYHKYNATSDIVAMYYVIEFAAGKKDTYSNASHILCKTGITKKPDSNKLERRNSLNNY